MASCSKSDPFRFFDRLPDHILISIFNLLPSCTDRMRLTLVSHRFNALLSLPAAWQTLDTIDLRFDEEIGNRREIEYLYINDKRFVFHKISRALESLLKRAKTHINKLTASITLDDDRSQSEPSICTAVCELFKHELKIKSFTFTGLSCVNFPVMLMNMFCGSLENLKLNFDYSGTGIQHLLLDAISRCDNLRSLSADFEEWYPSFSDTELLNVLSDKPLESLDLRNSYKLSKDTLVRIINEGSVKDLSLIECPKICPVDLIASISGQKRQLLENVALEFRADTKAEQCLLTLATDFPNLRKFFLLRSNGSFCAELVRASLDNFLNHFRLKPPEETRHIYLLYQVSMSDFYEHLGGLLNTQEKGKAAFERCFFGSIVKIFDRANVYLVKQGLVSLHVCCVQNDSSLSSLSYSSDTSLTDSTFDSFSEDSAGEPEAQQLQAQHTDDEELWSD